MRLTISLALALGAWVTAAQAQEDDSKKELTRLQGFWKRIEAEVEGKKADAKVLQMTTLTIEGEKYTLNSGGEVRKGVFKLDPTRSPKHIDIVSDAGPNKGKTLRGIYKVDGDLFTYVLANPGMDRPTDFAGKPGQSLYVNKRALK
jgi:uncharacterized protein (TIGR03067 family)